MSISTKKIIKNVKKNVLLRKEQKKYLNNLPTNKKATLTQQQRTEIEKIWGKHQIKPNFAWHEMYYALLGEMAKPELVPDDAFFHSLLKKLNSSKMVYAWSDKSYLSKIFEGLPMANTLVSCIDGRFYDDKFNEIEPKKALNIIESSSEQMIVKPSILTSKGRDVEIFNTDQLDEELLKKSAEDRERNCVYQEKIKQSQQLSRLNDSSVNVMRIISLRKGSEIYNLCTTIRFGSTGSLTDISFDENGNELLNLLGIDKSGKIMDKVVHFDGSSSSAEESGIKIGEHLEGYEEAIELTKQAHKRLHHFDLVGFDVTIDENNHPLIIEANIKSPGIYAYQLVHGPLFGEHLNDVLNLKNK